jgi:hypothetical protein
MPHENRADSPSVGCITLTLSWLYMLCRCYMNRPTIPISTSTCHSRSRSTVSKALRKSTKQQYTFLRLWVLCWMSICKMYKLSVVWKSFLKPAKSEWRSKNLKDSLWLVTCYYSSKCSQSSQFNNELISKTICNSSMQNECSYYSRACGNISFALPCYHLSISCAIVTTIVQANKGKRPFVTEQWVTIQHVVWV